MSTREKAKVAGASLKGAKKKLSEEEACLRPTRLSRNVTDKKVPVLGRVGGSEMSRAHWIVPKLIVKIGSGSGFKG